MVNIKKLKEFALSENLIESDSLLDELDVMTSQIDHLSGQVDGKVSRTNVVFNQYFYQLEDILKKIISMFGGSVDSSKLDSSLVDQINDTCIEFYPESNVISVQFGGIKSRYNVKIANQTLNYRYIEKDNIYVIDVFNDKCENADGILSCYISSDIIDIPIINGSYITGISNKSNAFSDNENLNLITLNTNRQLKISDIDFTAECINRLSGITSIQFSNNIQNIEIGILSGLSSLNHLIFNPDGKISQLKTNTIVSCNNLRYLNFPKSLSSIEASAIIGNEKLEEISFQNVNIPSAMIDDLYLNNPKLQIVTNLSGTLILNQILKFRTIQEPLNINQPLFTTPDEDWPELTGPCMDPYTEHDIYHLRSYHYTRRFEIYEVQTRFRRWRSAGGKSGAAKIAMYESRYHYGLETFKSETKQTGCNRLWCDYINGIRITSEQEFYTKEGWSNWRPKQEGLPSTEPIFVDDWYSDRSDDYHQITHDDVENLLKKAGVK